MRSQNSAHHFKVNCGKSTNSFPIALCFTTVPTFVSIRSSSDLEQPQCNISASTSSVTICNFLYLNHKQDSLDISRYITCYIKMHVRRIDVPLTVVLLLKMSGNDCTKAIKNTIPTTHVLTVHIEAMGS